MGSLQMSHKEDEGCYRPAPLIPLCLACSRPASPGDLALNQPPPLLRVCPCFSALVSRASVRGQKHLRPWAWGQTTASQTVASHIWKKYASGGCVLHPTLLCTAGDRAYPKAEGPTKAHFPGAKGGQRVNLDDIHSQDHPNQVGRLESKPTSSVPAPPIILFPS